MASTSTSSLNSPTLTLSTPFARTFTHLHPALLLSTLFLSFSSLVADPVSTASALVFPLALLQALYCLLCLPPRGDSPGTSSNARERRKGNSSSSHTNTNASTQTLILRRMVPTLLTLILSFTVPPLPLYALLVAHGAPLASHLPHTALLALHLSLLATPALFYVHGMSGATWCRLVSLNGAWGASDTSSSPSTGAGKGGKDVKKRAVDGAQQGGLFLDAPLAQALGTLLGAWLGAIPIPLDWDRAWQAWPVTVLVGAWVGSCVGKVVGDVVGGRKAWVVGFGA